MTHLLDIIKSTRIALKLCRLLSLVVQRRVVSGGTSPIMSSSGDSKTDSVAFDDKGRVLIDVRLPAGKCNACSNRKASVQRM
jgi:hypothetical protein